MAAPGRGAGAEGLGSQPVRVEKTSGGLGWGGWGGACARRRQE